MMNVFKQYGIREVADVIFYSITRIGNEEFYTPVLYFDTLKVSSLDKKITSVTQNGGKGNGRILNWNFNKDISLKFEDALFSQTSLDMFMNGRVATKLAPWTAAIAKLNVANKYGQKNYSFKAYPSPALTDEEWEIVYRCAQKAGYDPRTGFYDTMGNTSLSGNNHSSKYIYDEDMENDENTVVAENRWLLKNNYDRRKQKAPRERDISKYLDIDSSKYESVSFVLNNVPLAQEKMDWSSIQNLLNEQSTSTTCMIQRSFNMIYRDKTQSSYDLKLVSDQNKTKGKFYAIFTVENGKLILSEACINIQDEDQSAKVFYGNNNDVVIGDEVFLSHIYYYLFPQYLEEIIGDLQYCDMNKNIYFAMPDKIIDYISDEIKTFNQMELYENDLYESRYIDRFEKCIVENRNGLKIDVYNQMENIKLMYNNEQCDYIVFCDCKTMQPIIPNQNIYNRLRKQKAALMNKTEYTSEDLLAAMKEYCKPILGDEYVDSLTMEDFTVTRVKSSKNGQKIVYFYINKSEYIILKPGTIYYKKVRTIDDDINSMTYIGTDISIDQDTFSGEYLIVGETYIREQNTGKDRRCQIVVNRGVVSTSAKLNLQAGGNPTTFTMDVDALMPIKGKTPIELKLYDVEKDNVYGGTKIKYQNKNYSKTQPMQVREEIVINNEEIY